MCSTPFPVFYLDPYLPYHLLLFWFHPGLFAHHHHDIILPLLVVPCLHPQYYNLQCHSWWCHLIGHFSIWFILCFYLGHFPCLVITHLAPLGYIPICWCFPPILYFQWWYHHPRLHMLTLFHCLHFGFSHICLWLGYLGSTQNGIPLSHFCILLFSNQVVYPMYGLIIDG